MAEGTTTVYGVSHLRAVLPKPKSIDPAALSLVAVVHHRQRPHLARVGMFLLAEQWAGEPVVAEPDKAGKLGWCDPRVLPSNTIPYPAEGIRAWVEGDRLALHGWPTF